jgi:hypothetical protein
MGEYSSDEIELGEIEATDIDSSGIEAVDGSAVDPDNYPDQALLEERLVVERELLSTGQRIAALAERVATDEEKNDAMDIGEPKQRLAMWVAVTTDLQSRYHRLVTIEVLRARLRDGAGADGFPDGVALDFPGDVEWQVLDLLVEKVVEMAAHYDPTTALNHLANRVGDGPITAVDVDAVAQISGAMEVPPEIDLTDPPTDIENPLAAFHDEVVDSVMEVEKLIEELDVDAAAEDALLETLESDLDDPEVSITEPADQEE